MDLTEISIGVILIAITLLVPAYAIYSENSGKQADRTQFNLALFGSWFIEFAGRKMLLSGGPGVVTALIFWVLTLALLYFVFRISVQRARQAGYGKGICYLSLVPVACIVTLGILVFSEPETTDTSDEADQERPT